MPTKESRRWLCCLHDLDYECIRHIMAENVLVHQADAVRLALTRQVERDREMSSVSRYKEVAESCCRAYKDKVKGLPLKRWQQLYKGREIALMDAIQLTHGFKKRASALRFALRVQAHHDGMRVPGMT